MENKNMVIWLHRKICLPILWLLFIYLYTPLVSSALAHEVEEKKEERENVGLNMGDNANIGSVSNASFIGSLQNINIAHHNKRCDLDKLNNVPVLPEYFQERKKELNAIHKAVTENQKKTLLVALIGFSGAGKTELAKKYTNDCTSGYHHVRFFDASSKESLHTSFVSLATNLCIRDLADCQDPQGIYQENCTIDIVKRCLREMTGRFLWIFDNVKTYEDIKKYVPNESGISGIILITTQNKAEFPIYDENIDLSEGMTDEESCSLLNYTIQGAVKKLNIPVYCSNEEIKEIAVDVWKNLPLPVVYTGKLIGGHIGGNCTEYLEIRALIPKKVRDMEKKEKKVISDNFGLQEEAIGEQLLLLEKLHLKLNLYVIGLLSFVKFPLSENLVSDYINATERCRKILGITIVDFSSYREAELQHKADKRKITSEINGLSLIKVSGGQLAFPHELFGEQVQLFFLRVDEKNPGSYKQLFDETTEFLYQKFSGRFWDKTIWENEQETLLSAVENMVNTHMVDQHDLTNVKLRPFNDLQFILWYRLAKFYIENNPRCAVKLFGKLLKEVESNSNRDTKGILSNLFSFIWFDSSNDSGLSWYTKGSINHTTIMYYLAIANCQAQYYGADFDFDKIEGLAEKAYSIFENELGKENIKTLNAYLLLAHIRVNLKYKKPFVTPENYRVEFPESEPTIDAAIELIGFFSSPHDRKSFREKLSSAVGLSREINYPSIYTKLEEKMESSRQGKEDL